MAYKHFDWDKEVTLTLTVRDLYWLQHCTDSVLIMREISDFVVGYQPLTPEQHTEIYDALHKAVKVLKGSRK
jgi:hypothetical protein